MADEVLIVPSETNLALGAFQVVATVVNTGNAWAKLRPTHSQWTALDGAGGAITVGQMARAYPQYVEPGGTAYLVDYDVREDLEPERFATVDVSAIFGTVPDPGVTFQFPETSVRYDDRIGLVAVGVLTASADRMTVDVAVICVDAADTVRGVAEGRVARRGQALVHQRVKAWEHYPFETDGPPNELRPGTCADTVIAATASDR